MKVCIEWKAGFKYLAQIDEFNIEYKREKGKKLINFLDKYGVSQRVNIYLPEDVQIEDLKLLNGLKEKYLLAVVFPAFPDFMGDECVAYAKENGMKFYFATPVNNWERLLAFVEAGVSDVIISGGLGFDVKRVAAAVPANVQTRSYVNITQQDYPYGDGFKGFFIRPEDIETYSQYIDVFEFWDSFDTLNILYEIYFKDKEWNGNLQEIIKGLKLEINNYYILGSEFGNRRMSCDRKCLKGERCKLCDRLAELADSIENNDDFEVFKRR